MNLWPLHELPEGITTYKAIPIGLVKSDIKNAPEGTSASEVLRYQRVVILKLSQDGLVGRRVTDINLHGEKVKQINPNAVYQHQIIASPQGLKQVDLFAELEGKGGDEFSRAIFDCLDLQAKIYLNWPSTEAIISEPYRHATPKGRQQRLRDGNYQVPQFQGDPACAKDMLNSTERIGKWCTNEIEMMRQRHARKVDGNTDPIIAQETFLILYQMADILYHKLQYYQCRFSDELFSVRPERDLASRGSGHGPCQDKISKWILQGTPVDESLWDTEESQPRQKSGSALVSPGIKKPQPARKTRSASLAAGIEKPQPRQTRSTSARAEAENPQPAKRKRYCAVSDDVEKPEPRQIRSTSAKAEFERPQSAITTRSSSASAEAEGLPSPSGQPGKTKDFPLEIEDSELDHFYSPREESPSSSGQYGNPQTPPSQIKDSESDLFSSCGRQIQRELEDMASRPTSWITESRESTPSPETGADSPGSSTETPKQPSVRQPVSYLMSRISIHPDLLPVAFDVEIRSPPKRKRDSRLSVDPFTTSADPSKSGVAQNISEPFEMTFPLSGRSYQVQMMGEIRIQELESE